MRPGERDFLLLLLAGAAGGADAWSYMGLGHAFVANMTGNTVLIGLAVFTRHELTAPLLALCCYLLGTVAAAFATRRVGDRAFWPRAVSWTLLAEGLLLACAEAAWMARQHAPSTAHIPLPALLGCVGFSIGLQSGAMLGLRVPGIVTTYITGTWTTLARGLVRFEARKQDEPPREKRAFEERMLMQAGVVAVYFCAALLCGWLFRDWPAGMGIVPTTLVLAAAVYGLLRC